MDESQPSPPKPVLMAIVVEGGIGLIAVGLGWLSGDPPARQIAWTLDAVWNSLFATLPLVGVMWLLVRSTWRPIRRLMEMMDQTILPIFANTRVWEFVAIAAFAGLGEEMLFRGVIQNFVAHWFDPTIGQPTGLIAASILFGLLHWLTPGYAVLATGIGVYLGSLRILTGNLLVPALVHAIYDLWALVYLVRLRGPHRWPRARD